MLINNRAKEDTTTACRLSHNVNFIQVMWCWRLWQRKSTLWMSQSSWCWQRLQSLDSHSRQHLENRIIRNSWDFSISFQLLVKSFCNLFALKILHEPQIFTSACSQTHKFIDHVILAHLLRLGFYWITWKCVNEFSLRVTTLNSSLVWFEKEGDEQKSW